MNAGIVNEIIQWGALVLLGWFVCKGILSVLGNHQRAIKLIADKIKEL